MVFDELQRLLKEGFSKSAVDAAINTNEFALRENNTGSFPRGLALMYAAVNAWVYDKDPVENLKVGNVIGGHPLGRCSGNLHH